MSKNVKNVYVPDVEDFLIREYIYTHTHRYLYSLRYVYSIVLYCASPFGFSFSLLQSGHYSWPGSQGKLSLVGRVSDSVVLGVQSAGRPEELTLHRKGTFDQLEPLTAHSILEAP